MFDAIIIEIQETWKDAYKKFEVSRSNLKFNKRGGPNKVRGGGKKIAKLISGGGRLFGTQEYHVSSWCEFELNWMIGSWFSLISIN